MKKLLLLALILNSLYATAQLAPGAVVLEKDFHPGAASANPSILGVFNGKIALTASTGNGTGQDGYELYSYDVNGVATLFDIFPGNGNGILQSVIPMTMTSVGTTAYFAADDGSTGYELFQWDGNNLPTLAADINGGVLGSEPHSLTTLNGKVYFAASTPATGIELWVYDPATITAQLVSDIFAGSTDAYPRQFAAFNGKLYFSARNASTDHELFVHDPVANTTTMVDDYLPGAFGSNPTSLTVINNKLYFLASDGVYGRELQVMDAAENITRLTDIEPSISGGGILGGHEFFMQLGHYNNSLYFIGLEGAQGQALYKYDLMSPGTAKITSLNTTPSTFPGVPPTSFANYAGKLFFVGDDGIHGQELWVYDGATAPYMVADIDPGISAGDPLFMTVFNNKLYFSATNSLNTGAELYSFTDSSLSIQRVKFDGSISAHPNPANTVLNISIDIPTAAPFAISITGIDGRQQLSAPLRRYEAGHNTATFDMTALTPGVYLYTVKTEDGSLCQSGQIIKQ